jgi:hypothetical protein
MDMKHHDPDIVTSSFDAKTSARPNLTLRFSMSGSADALSAQREAVLAGFGRRIGGEGFEV